MKEWSNNRVILRNDILSYLGGQIVLISDHKTRKKAPVDCQGRQSRERLVERPWLQLMCCVLASSHEVGHVFQSSKSCQDRDPKRQVEELERIKYDQDQLMLIYRLRNYTVTTQYLQEVWNRRRVVYYTNFRRIIRRNKLYNYHISGI